MSLQRNTVVRAGDDIENVYTFQNTGTTRIPAGTKFLSLSGDFELALKNVVLEKDVSPNEYFNVRVSLKAPALSKHYKAVYTLMDDEGTYFGDKVDLDFIVEEDCSESVILQEFMNDSVADMSVQSLRVLNPSEHRSERISMMAQRRPEMQPQMGAN